MVHEFYIPIIKTFGYDHFSKYHDSHYSKLYRIYSNASRTCKNKTHIRNVAMTAGFKAGAAWWFNKERSDEVKKLVLASYYHDVFSDVRRSAKFARKQVMELGFSTEYGDFVFNSIKATKTHKTKDPVIQHLLDADLNVFTSYSSGRYIEYMLNSRLERPGVSDAQYADERYAELEHLKRVFKFEGEAGARDRAIRRAATEQKILFQFKCITMDSECTGIPPRPLILVLSELDYLTNKEYPRAIKIN